MAVSARIENLASWFAASVLVTAGVIYALKLEDDRPRSHHILVPPRASRRRSRRYCIDDALPNSAAGAMRVGRCEYPGAAGRTSSWRVVPIVEFGNDRLLALAAGVMFYVLLALFPAITAGCRPTRCLPMPATVRIWLAVAGDACRPVGINSPERREDPHRSQERAGGSPSASCSALGSRCGAPMPA